MAEDSKNLTDALVLPGQQTCHVKLDAGEPVSFPADHYRLYFEVLDLLDGELDRRFEPF